MAVTSLTANAADARVRVSNTNWTTARNATSGTLQGSTVNPTGWGSDFSSPNYGINRFFMYFDASGISATDTVDSATFTFHLSSGASGATQDIHIVESSAGTTVAAGDFDKLNFTSFGSVSVNNTSGDFVITLNSTGLTYLENNLGGNIKLAAIGGGDQSNTPPGSASFKPVNTGDDATNPPTLEITHSTPNTFIPKVMFF